MTATSPAASAARAGDLFGHPRGLWVLAGTELWDRISFQGMQALLALYMTGVLLLPGHIEHIGGFAAFRALVEGVTGPLSVQALAAQTFGLYVGLIFFTPVIGGMIGDRLIGRRVAVTIGALLMTIGHFALALDATFLLALALLIVGTGFLRGNLSAQIKSLYADGDRREAEAFQFYYIGINLGAFIAPILTGALAVIYGWHAGFAFAGFGMLIGLGFYLAGQRFLPPETKRIAAVARGALTTDERRRVIGLALVWPGTVTFWVAQTQVWNVYNLWVRDHLDLRLGTFTVPVPWLQALDGVAPIIFMPVVLKLWKRQADRGREPRALAKLSIGCAIFAAGVLWLAAAPLLSDAQGRAPLLWGVGFHAISNLGWLFFTPIGLALYGIKSPPSMRGALIGIWTAAVFAASLISGRLGGFYETMPASRFWLLHAAIVGAGSLYFLVLAGPIQRLFQETDASADELPLGATTR